MIGHMMSVALYFSQTKKRVEYFMVEKHKPLINQNQMNIF